MSNLDLHVPPRKDLIQIGLKILSVTHIKSSKIGPEMAEKVQGQSLTVRKDLANPSDLDQPLRSSKCFCLFPPPTDLLWYNSQISSTNATNLTDGAHTSENIYILSPFMLLLL